VAEVTHKTGLIQQLLLVMQVRWLTVRNGLRSQSEKMHFAGTIFLSLLFILMSLGVGVGVGVGSHELARTGGWAYLSLILWGIFFFWQVVPVLATQTGGGFDGQNLLRFPLRFSTFLLMSVAYGLADPFALTGMFWHIVMCVAVSMARPELTGWAVLALGGSIITNLLFNRMVASWLERVLAKRRTREIFTAVFILLIVCLQFSGIIVQRWGPSLRHFINGTSTVWRLLPPGVAGRVLEHAANGDAQTALLITGLLGLYAATFCGLFAIRVHAQFTGEDLGESAAPTPRKVPAVRRATVSIPQASEGARSAGRTMGLVSAPVAAIFLKEVRYFYRNTMMMLNLFIPIILIAVFTQMPTGTRNGGRSPFGTVFAGDYLYPGAAAYFVLLIMQFCPNNMAYEGRGVERLFLAPVDFRNVMMGKNLFHGTLLALEALMALAMVTAMGHAPRLPILLATWTALPFAAFMHFALGNWLSLQYPRRFEFGVKRQRPSGMTMAINLGLNIGVMAVIALMTAICVWFAGLWLLPVVYLAMSAAGYAVYHASLDNISKQALAQREVLIEQLAK
jgi:ABC-2 type transport system permease protein